MAWEVVAMEANMSEDGPLEEAPGTVVAMVILEGPDSALDIPLPADCAAVVTGRARPSCFGVTISSEGLREN